MSKMSTVHAVLRSVDYDALFGHGWQYDLPEEEEKKAKEPVYQQQMMLEWIQELGYDVPWTPCDHGEIGVDGAVTRLEDRSVRMCMKRQLTGGWRPSDWFSHSALEIIMASGLRVNSDKVLFKNAEVLKYGVGGHFKPHVDRRLAQDHVGTLLIVVPSIDMEGGALVVKGGELVVKTGDTYDNSQLTRTYAAFIPLGVCHKVAPVRRGERYVLKVAVYAKLLQKGEKPKLLKRRLCD